MGAKRERIATNKTANTPMDAKAKVLIIQGMWLVDFKSAIENALRRNPGRADVGGIEQAAEAAV
jgi:hypothetical protein